MEGNGAKHRRGSKPDCQSAEDRVLPKRLRLRKPTRTRTIKDMQAFQFTLTCEKGKS